jgi:hypothetical protein
MKVDILPVFLLASALAVSGGAWIGYKLSVAARAALREDTPKPPPPIEAPPTTPEVGQLSDGILHVPTTVVYGGRAHFYGGFPALPVIHFFDFKHAVCDEAESIHGKVLRCGKPH